MGRFMAGQCGHMWCGRVAARLIAAITWSLLAAVFAAEPGVAQELSGGTQRLPAVDYLSASSPDGQLNLPERLTYPRGRASLLTLASAAEPADLVPLDCQALDECARCRPRPLDTASVFLGLDGSKQPQDFGINAQFGGRAAFNWGFALCESLGLGAQLGTAIDATGDAVGVVQRIQGSSGRTQSFTTVGLFQRTPMGLNWGVVYDLLAENYYDSFFLGQWRLNVGYQLSPRNQVGVWSAIADHHDHGQFLGIPVTLTPITQTNIYLNHDWGSGLQTMFWGGLANSHGRVNAVLGDQSRVHDAFVFGSQLHIPLTEKLALFGQGNFIMPASSGTVDSYLGFVYYPHGGSRRGTPSAFSPLQTVAAPTNFAVDLRR